MQSKSLLIAIAAFAVTTTGVHAYNGAKILNRVGLSDEQKSALTQAQELKESGDYNAARDLLEEAGIDGRILRSIDRARHAVHAEMVAALTTGDYTAFRAAVEGSPLADLITTRDDFETFREAHELRAAGEFDEAASLFAELDIDRYKMRPVPAHGARQAWLELNGEQQEAFLVAKQANDRATMHAILDEAGVDRWSARGYGPR